MACGKAMVAGLCLFALVMAPSVWAEDVPLLGASSYRTGGLYYSSGYGNSASPMGYISPFVPGRNCGGGHGFAFDGPTQVTSLTWEPSLTETGRDLVKGFDVYANGMLVGIVEFADVREKQTALIMGRDADGKSTGQPIVVTANWLTLVVRGMYSHGDTNSGVRDFYFSGTPYAGPVEANLNHTLNPTITASPLNNPHSNSSPYCVVNGNLACTSNGDSYFWGFDDSETGKSVTFDYGDQPVDVRSVGLALFANEPDRAAPRWVEITGSQPGQSYTLYLDGTFTYYNRYDLLDENGLPMTWNTTSLTVTFPTGNSDADWWPGTRNWYGLTEFQVFDHVTPEASFALASVPEPATMTLLALGGLAMLKRRRGCGR